MGCANSAAVDAPVSFADRAGIECSECAESSGHTCRRIDGIHECCHIDGMTRTQIQLPDETYARAKKLCEAREIPLAELARRGIEYILSVYASEEDAKREWQPPKPRKLGWKGLTDAELKLEAQMTNTELALTRGRNK